MRDEIESRARTRTAVPRGATVATLAGVGVLSALAVLAVLAATSSMGDRGGPNATASPPQAAAATITSAPTKLPIPTPRPIPTSRPLPAVDTFTPFPVSEPTYPPGGPWQVGPVTFDLPEGWGIPNPFGLALIAYLSERQDPDAGIYHLALPGGQVPSNLSLYRFFQQVDGHGWSAGLHAQVFTRFGGDVDATTDDLVAGLEENGNVVTRRTVRLPIGSAWRLTWNQSYGSTTLQLTRYVIGAGDEVVAIDLGTRVSTPKDLLDVFLSIVRSARA